MMNPQIPLPSFEDIRKILQFWIDQQDKWFYFETAIIHSGSTGQSEVPNPLQRPYASPWSRSSEINEFIQARIVGCIKDVISYPPSLLLKDVSVFTVCLTNGLQYMNLISIEKRNKYGLVFSQITYYEPIDNIEEFLVSDARVAIH
jgi:hypothetical protein